MSNNKIATPKVQPTGRLTKAEIDALQRGDKVWQVGEKQQPDKELTVRSKGPIYMRFTATIYFDRKHQRLSNNRYMYRTQEDLERDKVNLQRIKKITEILSSVKVGSMNGVADLFTVDEVADIYDRFHQQWPWEFKCQDGTNEQ